MDSANTSETNKPVRWSTPEGRANMLLAQLTDSVLVWAIRQPAEIQVEDKELLKALREKYAKVKSQEAYQQDWANISQQPGEQFDDYYSRLEVAYDNAYREPEFRESMVKSRLLAEKFRDSIRDLRARESILDKGILDDTGKLKDSGVIIAIAKRATEVGDLLKSSPTARVTPLEQAELESMVNNAVVAALQCRGAQPSNRARRGNNPNKYWRCHCCNTTNHPGGWKACPHRQKYNPSWQPCRPKPKANRVQQPSGEQPPDKDFPQNL